MQACAVKQLGHDAAHAFERVGNGARLLEDFLVCSGDTGPAQARAAVEPARCAQGARQASAPGAWPHPGHDPVAAQLRVHQVTLFRIDDSGRYARQAMASLARKCSGAVVALRAGMSGEPARAPTTRWGSSLWMTAMA